MSAITPNTPKTDAGIPITPGKRQTKRQKQIANSKPQAQQTVSTVDTVYSEQNKAYLAEIERLTTELTKKDNQISQLKERSKVLTRKFAEHVESSPKAPEDAPYNIGSEVNENNLEASNTESSESESLVDAEDVQHPTQIDLIAHLAETTLAVDHFKALDHDIGALRNDTKKDYANAKAQVSADSLKSSLTAYDILFESYKVRYEQQYYPFMDVIANLEKLIKSAEQSALSDAHKKAFSAYTGMSLTQINAKEDAYKKAVEKCKALFSSLQILLNNTIDRFQNAVAELNSIDAYIHTSGGGVVATLKYKTGYGQQKVRTFEVKPKKLEAQMKEEENKVMVPKEEPLITKEEVKQAEASNEAAVATPMEETPKEEIK